MRRPTTYPPSFSDMLSGSVAWGDASIIVPYALYKRYDDVRILEENYEMMKGWMRFLQSRANKPDSPSQFENNPWHTYTIETGVDYGEWCEPGMVAQMAMAKPQYKVSTAYYSPALPECSPRSRRFSRKEEDAGFLPGYCRERGEKLSTLSPRTTVRSSPIARRSMCAPLPSAS